MTRWWSRVLKVRPNRDTAVSTQGGRFGALVPDEGTAFLNETFPRGRYVWRLDRQRGTGTLDLPGSAMKTITVPLRPMLGRVATAPEGAEAFDGLWPGPFGGNMDTADVREGTTVYLPVQHPGALFYFGDGHALQGDGEVCGSGLETSMEVSFRFGLLKKKTLAWPRLEDAEHIMVAGSARPLSDALRIAFVELIRWMVDEYGFGKADAYQVVSQLAVVRVAKMVDPLYTVVAKFPKRHLPARSTAARPGAPGVRVGELRWPEAERVLTADRVVVLPLGAAAKEHGPHLLLRNDQILADYHARRVLQARPVAMLPTLTYGFYPAFLEYPGSTSVSFDTQRDTVVRSRGRSRATARAACTCSTPGSRRSGPAGGGRGAGPRRRAHALHRRQGGRTSRRRRRARAEDGHPCGRDRDLDGPLHGAGLRAHGAGGGGRPGGERGRARSRAIPATRTGHYSPSGVFGDATLASRAKGERVTEAMVADILPDIDALAAEPLPAGDPGSPLDGVVSAP